MAISTGPFSQSHRWNASAPGGGEIRRFRMSPEAKQRAGRLVLMGCIACGRVPAQIHHLRDGHGLSERAPWWETIPLCNEHHNGSQTSTHGALRREFHHAHGSEREMLQRVNERLPEELRGGAN